MISHATAPATVAHRYPTRPQPTTNVAAATTTRSPASVTISDPYAVHRFSPASMPSSVACRQKPASPTHSSATRKPLRLDEHMARPQRRSSRRSPRRRRRRPSRPPASDAFCADLRSATLGRSASRRAHLPGGLLQQAERRAGGQAERAPEHAEHREARRLEIAGGQIEHRVSAQRGQHGRRADPGHAAARDRTDEPLARRIEAGARIRHDGASRAGSSVEYSHASHSGRSDSSRVIARPAR